LYGKLQFVHILNGGLSMRNLLLLLFLVLTLAACSGGGGGGDVPTLVPTVGGSGQDGGDGDAPRITPDSGLPPTWTPEPTPIPATLPPPSATTGPGTPVPSGDGTYTVQAGDTLAEIAARFNITVADLAEANDIDNIDVIEVGQVLVIP
jgi:LysM repeat protein